MSGSSTAIDQINVARAVAKAAKLGTAIAANMKELGYGE
jgi:hypothetical protein